MGPLAIGRFRSIWNWMSHRVACNCSSVPFKVESKIGKVHSSKLSDIKPWRLIDSPIKHIFKECKMSSAKFCHCSTGLLKNVYLVLINSLRYRKKFLGGKFSYLWSTIWKVCKAKATFYQRVWQSFFRLYTVSKYVKGFWKKIRKQFYGLMVCQSTWEWKKVFLKMELGIPEKHSAVCAPAWRGCSVPSRPDLFFCKQLSLVVNK